MKMKIVVMLLAAGVMPMAFADNICKQVDDKGEVTFIDCANAEKGAEKIKLEKSNTVSMPKGSSAPVQSEEPRQSRQPARDTSDIAPLDGNNVYVDDDTLRERRMEKQKRKEYREEKRETRKENGSVNIRPKEVHRPIATPRPAAPRARAVVR